MIKTVCGDLILLAKEGKFDVICHGANCMVTMGAGIAKQIKKMFPEAYKADQKTLRGDRRKLGTCTWANCEGVIVINAYTQFGYGRGRMNVDYDAIRSCMKWIAEKYRGKRIGLPKIGAGLGGGDWTKIKQIIEDELGDLNVTIVEKFGS
jgi:O-acetyl-ADP-ribose deacetylase (regulator of RNase III)